MNLTSLPDLAISLARLCLWLALLAAIFVPLERLFAIRPQTLFRRDIWTDLGYYFLSSLLPGLLLALPLAAVAWVAHAALGDSITSVVAHWPLWLKLPVALVVAEIGSYWGHRLSHEIPLLWRFHAIHHSAEHIDWLVNTRAHPIDMVFTRLCGLVPLYVLGLAAPAGNGTLIPVIVALVGTIWGFFVHANVRWRFGWLESLLATPAFHHWHHTNDGPDVIDKNYAATLPWIDRIFGTFHLPPDRLPERYGIDAQIEPGLVGQLYEPFTRPPAAPASPAAR